MHSKFPPTFLSIVIETPDDFDRKWHDKNCTILDKKRLCSIFCLISYPITIFIEFDYVDKVYRDSYYTFFSNKHLVFERNCKRLSLFKGKINQELLLDFSAKNEELLQEKFIGTVVLRPLCDCYIGRTLLDASKLSIPKCYIRTTKFNCIIFGHDLTIEAFPFSSQDAETMTCAETSVWSILEYYGTRYPEYRTVLPSSMLKKLDEMSYERNLPSKGLSYQVITALLKTFGFSPRLYSREVYEKYSSSENFKRIFHYYIESGIPVALGIERNTENITEKHSVVAIGHSKKQVPISSAFNMTGNDFPIVNTADLYNEYIIMDDNQIPYTTEIYDHFSLYKNGKALFLSVPLYKRIFLEAQDAECILYTIINADGFKDKIKKELKVSETSPLVLRIYLTSSRKFKKLRSSRATSLEECAFYQQLVYPKFLWVGELFTPESYEKEKIFGEIVLDATADRHNKTNSIILIRLLNKFSYRLPDFSIADIDVYDEFDDSATNQPYKMYKNNLNEGGL